MRDQVLARYPSFYRNLLNSPSKEVRILARMVKNDVRSTTFANLKYLREVTKLAQPEQFGSARMKLELPVREVPDREKWRLGLISNLLKIREEKFLDVKDSKKICGMLESLCNT